MVRNFRCDFSVMIWGPAENREGYAKRVQIKKKIKESFNDIDPFFPEERIGSLYPELKTLEEKEEAMVYDSEYILALEISDGAEQEVARYCHIAPWKFFLMIPKEHQGKFSFPGEIRQHADKHFFTEEEFKKCDLTEEAVRFIQSKLYIRVLRSVSETVKSRKASSR